MGQSTTSLPPPSKPAHPRCLYPKILQLSNPPRGEEPCEPCPRGSRPNPASLNLSPLRYRALPVCLLRRSAHTCQMPTAWPQGYPGKRGAKQVPVSCHHVDSVGQAGSSAGCWALALDTSSLKLSSINQLPIFFSLHSPDWLSYFEKQYHVPLAWAETWDCPRSPLLSTPHWISPSPAPSPSLDPSGPSALTAEAPCLVTASAQTSGATFPGPSAMPSVLTPAGCP